MNTNQRPLHLINATEPFERWLLELACTFGELAAEQGLEATTYTSGGDNLEAEQNAYDASYRWRRAQMTNDGIEE